MTYLLTFSCYGQRLHGDARGTVHKQHNRYLSRTQPPDRLVNTAEQQRLNAPPCQLGQSERPLVLDACVEVCGERGWQLLAAHIRSTHVHLVVAGDAAPEVMLRTFKAYGSRRLNAAGGNNRPRWAVHGSTRYLWNSHSIAAACEYVNNDQGDPMTVYAGESTGARR